MHGTWEEDEVCGRRDLKTTVVRVTMQHFLLTRFNILLWSKDKEGNAVRNVQWLEHRFALFERYCLPSVMQQTCQNFEWIVLFDSKTPERFRTKIDAYQKMCPQIVLVFVEPEQGRYFATIFRDEIAKRLRGERVLSTYLDNDDALNMRFVEDLQRRAETLADGTFIRYSDGYQYYTEGGFMLQIHYPRNHFVSVVEKGNPTMVKGIFGYGRHFYIDDIEGAKIEVVTRQPMWCEVVHEKNMINDANFLIGTKVVRNKNAMREGFAVDEEVDAGGGVYCFKFLPRYVRTFVKRAKNKLFGRKW